MSILLMFQGAGPPAPTFFGWRTMTGVGLSLLLILLMR